MPVERYDNENLPGTGVPIQRPEEAPPKKAEPKKDENK